MGSKNSSKSQWKKYENGKVKGRVHGKEWAMRNFFVRKIREFAYLDDTCHS